MLDDEPKEMSLKAHYSNDIFATNTKRESSEKERFDVLLTTMTEYILKKITNLAWSRYPDRARPVVI